MDGFRKETIDISSEDIYSLEEKLKKGNFNQRTRWL